MIAAPWAKEGMDAAPSQSRSPHARSIVSRSQSLVRRWTSVPSWLRTSGERLWGVASQWSSSSRILDLEFHWRALLRQCLLSGIREDSLSDRNGEGFRVPPGVRKPLMQEPAGHSRWLWGFRISAYVVDGTTAVGKHAGACGQAGSFHLRAVMWAWRMVVSDPVSVVAHHRRARVRRRRPSACGWRLDDSMPGHGRFSRFDVLMAGGPRGCRHRSNTSITIMRPPQQEHGGRTSSGSAV